MQQQPLVSIIIPSFNSKKWLKEALQSVYEQTYKNIEVIVVDDGSTDGTKEFIKKYNKPIMYFYQKNKGPSSARNLGIEKSKGEYIAFLDSDDLWKKNKLEKQMKFLEKNKNVHLLLTNVSVVDENGQYLYTNYNNVPSEKKELIIDLFKGKITMNTPTIIAKKSSVIQIGGLSEELPMREDHFFLMEMANSFQISHLKEDLVKRRIRKSSISHSAKPESILDLHKPFIEKSLEKFPFLSLYKNDVVSNLYISTGKKYWKASSFKESLKYLKSGINLNPFIFRNYMFFILVLLKKDYYKIDKVKIKIKQIRSTKLNEKNDKMYLL